MQAEELFINKADGAFRMGERSIDFSTFKAEVASYASYFSKLKESNIGLYIENDAYLFAVCFFAILQAGKAVSLLPFIKESFTFPLDLLITNYSETACYNTLKVPVQLQETAFDFKRMGSEQICFFSSGSTGVPKKIVKTYHNLAAEIENILSTQAAHLDKKPTVISSVVSYHMYGMLWDLLFPLSADLTIDTELVQTEEGLRAKLSRYEKLLFVTTPTFLAKLFKYDNDLQYPKKCLAVYTSGSLLTEEVSELAYQNFGVSPFEIFGSTETGGVAYRQQRDGTAFNIFPPVKAISGDDGGIVVESEFCASVPFKMGDAVEFVTERSFLLKQRLDRTVKIAEKLVDMPALESWLNQHDYVQNSYCLVLDDNLAVAVVLNDAGKEFLLSHPKKELNTILRQHLGLKCEVLPKRFRYVYELPTNSQGKYLKDEIKGLFDNNLSEPLIWSLKIDNNTLRAELSFVPDAIYFKGHFPEVSILPGVAQLHFVHWFLRRFLGQGYTHYDITKLKFSNVIFPKERVVLEINKVTDKRYTFSFKRAEATCSSGVLTEQS